MAASGESATTSTCRPALGLGDEVTSTGRRFGLHWRRVGQVTEYDRPHRFVYEQVRGPFRRMRHEHLFEAVGEGTTRMTDRIAFEAPLGPIGAVVGRAILAPYLRRLLEQRAAYVRELAEDAAQPPEVPRRRR